MKNNNRYKNKIHRMNIYNRGFTLVEMLIVLVIIGIIAAFAYPSYQRHTLRANRSDAITALASLAISQEKMLALNGKYSNSSSELGITTSPNGLYEIRVVYGHWNGADCRSASDSGTSERQYTLMAIPVVGKAQDKDTECQCLYINDADNKGATGSNPSGCWR